MEHATSETPEVGLEACTAGSVGIKEHASLLREGTQTHILALTGTINVSHELVGAALSRQHTRLACLQMEVEETAREKR